MRDAGRQSWGVLVLAMGACAAPAPPPAAAVEMTAPVASVAPGPGEDAGAAAAPAEKTQAPSPPARRDTISQCDPPDEDLNGRAPSPADLPPAVAALAASFRGGFAATKARLARLGVKPRDLQGLSATAPCFDEPEGCVRVAFLGEPVSGKRVAVLEVRDGSEVAGKVDAIFPVFAVEGTASRAIGFVRHGGGAAPRPFPRAVIAAGGRSWIAFNGWSRGGLGIMSVQQTWYSLGGAPGGELPVALTFVRAAHALGDVPFHDRIMRADVAETGVTGGRAHVELRLSACHMGPVTMDYDDYWRSGPAYEEAFVREGRARYAQAAPGAPFKLQAGHGALTEPQLDSFVYSSQRAFIEASAAEMRALAARRPEARAKLKRYLDTFCFGAGDIKGDCKGSPEAAALLKELP